MDAVRNSCAHMEHTQRPQQGWLVWPGVSLGGWGLFPTGIRGEWAPSGRDRNPTFRTPERGVLGRGSWSLRGARGWHHGWNPCYLLGRAGPVLRTAGQVLSSAGQVLRIAGPVLSTAGSDTYPGRITENKIQGFHLTHHRKQNPRFSLDASPKTTSQVFV